jgi:hypothetical protein
MPVMLNELETDERRLNSANATNIIAETGVELLDPDGGSGSQSPAQEASPQPVSALEAHCLWCGRTFTPRVTGRTPTCILDSRAALDDAGDRYGLLSVDCLKASQGSVHAAGGALRIERQPRSPDRGAIGPTDRPPYRRVLRSRTRISARATSSAHRGFQATSHKAWSGPVSRRADSRPASLHLIRRS